MERTATGALKGALRDVLAAPETPPGADLDDAVASHVHRGQADPAPDQGKRLAPHEDARAPGDTRATVWW
jgi:hypothetical protein